MTTTATYNKTAWLGNYPTHWKVLRAKYLFDNIDERSEFGSEELLSVSEHHGVIKRKNANVNMFMAENYEGYKLCKKGDLVINSLWAWSRGLGFSDEEGIVSTAYGVFRTKKNKVRDVNYSYFHHLLRTKLYVGEFGIRSKGIWISRLLLSDKNFLEIPILIPPLTEQIAIANYIQAKEQKINHFIAKKQQFIALLKEQRQSLINEAVTKGKRTRLKNIVTTNDEALGESTDENYLLRYIDIGNVNSDGTITDIQEYTFKNAPSRARRIVRKGDIIISTVRTYLQAITLINEDAENLIASTGFAVLRPKENIDVEFLNYALRGNHFIDSVNKNSYGVSYPAINSTTLSALSIFIPNSKNEQTQIVNHIKSETATIDTAIAKTEREIELIKEYKEAMIAEAVMGKIDMSQKLTTTKKKIVTDEFKEAILISKLVKEFSKPEYPLGRMRYTKLSYLFHRYTDNRTQDYQKKAAGPYNPKTKYAGPEKIAIQNKYILEQGNRNYKGFVPNEKIADVENYFSHYWSEETFKWLEQFRYKKNDELELYATIDKAIEELKEKSIDPTLENIKTLISDTKEWKAKLDREIFSDKKIMEAMDYVNKLFS